MPTSQRLRQMQGFTRVAAPFSGVITRRNVDIGDLIDGGGKTAVRADADGSAARLHQRAAVLCAAGQAGAEGGRDPGRAARQDLRRRGGAHGGLDRHRQPHHAGRGRLANRDGALLPGAYVQVALPLPASGGADGADQRAAVPRRRHARRRGRRARQGAAAPGDAGPQLRRGDRDRSTASDRATGWCSTRPIRSPMAMRWR